MKKIITLILIGCSLSGCFLRPHKLDIQQGNIITEDKASMLRPGMSEAQVKEIMGNPVLINLFSPNRLEYVYTFKPAYGTMTETRITCIFQGGRLREIRRYPIG